MKALINIASLVGIELGKTLHHLKGKDPPNLCNMELKMVMKRLLGIKTSPFEGQGSPQPIQYGVEE